MVSPNDPIPDDTHCGICGKELPSDPEPGSLPYDGYCDLTCKIVHDELIIFGRTPSWFIDSEAKVLVMLEAKTREQAKRHVYKYTDCGAWIHFEGDGIRLGSTVEGLDGDGTKTYTLTYPFTASDYVTTIDAIEKEAHALWNWANGGGMDEGLDPPDVG